MPKTIPCCTDGNGCKDLSKRPACSDSTTTACVYIKGEKLGCELYQERKNWIDEATSEIFDLLKQTIKKESYVFSGDDIKYIIQRHYDKRGE